MGMGVAIALGAAALVVSLIALAFVIGRSSAPSTAATVAPLLPAVAPPPVALAPVAAPAAPAVVAVAPAPAPVPAAPVYAPAPVIAEPAPVAAPVPQPALAMAQPSEPVVLIDATSQTAAGRSAIPQEGESLSKPINPGQLNGGSSGGDTPAAAGEVIPWNEAGRHLGQEITIEGRVVNTHNTGNVCFLNFTTQRSPGTFYVIIFKDALGAWSEPPEKYFLNRKIRATGKVHQHKDMPQIRIQQSGQLQRVD
jgi:hypothetical protein